MTASPLARVGTAARGRPVPADTGMTLEALEPHGPNWDVRRVRFLPYGWPLTALFCGLGLWWAMGLSGLIVHLLALPMLWHLICRGRVRLPPGFALWALFLAWTLISLVMLGYNPPGTLQEGSINGRLLAVAFRMSTYLAATIALLYVGNLDPARYPTRKLVRVMGVGFAWVVAGGFLGMLRPRLEFVSPVERLLPESIRDNLFVQSLVHPSAAQLQELLGYETPRPAAPFGYTNMWGHVFALLLPWFFVGFVLMARGWKRWAAALLLLAAVVPMVYSLNRGLWVGLGLVAAYTVGRMIAQGRLWVGGIAAAAVAVGLTALMFSPLQTLVSGRLDNGASNDVRAYSISKAIEISKLSPIIGYGNTRTAVGSPQSLTIGKSPECPKCGNVPLGINGQLWLEIVAHGFVGAALYITTFLYIGLRYWRDRGAVAVIGVLTALIMLWFMFIYGSLPWPITIAFIGWAVLWRDELHRREPA